jgi:hypothetical protein
MISDEELRGIAGKWEAGYKIPVPHIGNIVVELLHLREEKRHPQAFIRAASAEGFGYAVAGETEVIAITVTWEDADVIADEYALPVVRIEDMLKEGS